MDYLYVWEKTGRPDVVKAKWLGEDGSERKLSWVAEWRETHRVIDRFQTMEIRKGKWWQREWQGSTWSECIVMRVWRLRIRKVYRLQPWLECGQIQMTLLVNMHPESFAAFPHGSVLITSTRNRYLQLYHTRNFYLHPSLVLKVFRSHHSFKCSAWPGVTLCRQISMPQGLPLQQPYDELMKISVWIGG